jgi:hypothetical protein
VTAEHRAKPKRHKHSAVNIASSYNKRVFAVQSVAKRMFNTVDQFTQQSTLLKHLSRSFQMSTDVPERKFFVIGAGLCRTGTSSFKKALEILGVGPCYHMMEVGKNNDAAKWDEFSRNPADLELLDSLLRGHGYKSSCDLPSSPYWREQLALYPEAKVVLTARDAAKWYQSCEDTVFRMQRNHPLTPFGIKLCYWFGIISKSFGDFLDEIFNKRICKQNWEKEHVMTCYDEYNRDIIANCPKEKLLVFEVTQGWKPLCQFLDVPVPKEPFPHVNDTKSFQAFVTTRERSGYLAFGGVIAGTALVAWAGSAYLRRK